MGFIHFLGYAVLFAAALFLSMTLGTAGVVTLGGIPLPILWMLLQKPGEIDQKLNELLERRDKHDVR